jgi:hypothetical protein
MIVIQMMHVPHSLAAAGSECVWQVWRDSSPRFRRRFSPGYRAPDHNSHIPCCLLIAPFKTESQGVKPCPALPQTRVPSWSKPQPRCSLSSLSLSRAMSPKKSRVSFTFFRS